MSLPFVPPQTYSSPNHTPPGHTWASRGIRLLPSTVGKQSLVQTNITTTNITYRSTLNFDCPYFWYPPTPHGPHGSCVLYGICECFTSFWEFISRTIIAYFFCLVLWPCRTTLHNEGYIIEFPFNRLSTHSEPGFGQPKGTPPPMPPRQEFHLIKGWKKNSWSRKKKNLLCKVMGWALLEPGWHWGDGPLRFQWNIRIPSAKGFFGSTVQLPESHHRTSAF